MNEYMHRDHLRELWMQIDKLHLSYLQTDETLYKLEQRSKLESYIREYLCVAPHDRKFCFRETANVLRQSATLKEGFSAYRAACAWDAIGLYAANLLSQPWRKEYRELKMYCGFYKHEVEANLIGAEVMLEAMGYKHVGNTTMVLDGPIDPDRVSSVSRDSLMATVECQLLKAIWEEVSHRFQCQWLDVLEFRENHICSPENAVKGLMYQFHQREYQEQHQHQMALYHQMPPTSDNYGTSRFHHPPPNCMYGQISPSVAPVPHMGYYNYSPYTMSAPHAYTLPSQPRYGTVMSPQQPPMPFPVPLSTLPPYLPAPIHGVIKSQEIYPANGHNALDQYQTPVPVAPPAPAPPVPGMQMALHNGYSMPPSQSAPHNYGCLVPTGQLIELDNAPPAPSCSTETQQTLSATDSSGSVLIPRSVRQHQNHHAKKASHDKPQETCGKLMSNSPGSNYMPESSKSSDQTSRKTKDEVTGTFESWDYVFRNLESQGYSKDLGERPDILSPLDSKSNHKSERGYRNKETEALDLEDTLMEMRLEEMQRRLIETSEIHHTMKINEALQKMKLDSNTEHFRSKPPPPPDDLPGSNASVYDNMSSPPKEIGGSQKTHATDGSKSNVVSGKAATKTLMREPKKHESKRLAWSSSHVSSATLDPRQLKEQSNYSSSTSNPVDAPDIHLEEKPFLRKISTQKNRSSDNPGDKRGEETWATDGEKWECVTCTFHNEAAREICEMCGKSKVRGSECRPLASGGRECPQCTLVNEKDIGTCVACDCSLKDSPTYI